MLFPFVTTDTTYGSSLGSVLESSVVLAGRGVGTITVTWVVVIWSSSISTGSGTCTCTCMVAIVFVSYETAGIRKRMVRTKAEASGEGCSPGGSSGTCAWSSPSVVLLPLMTSDATHTCTFGGILEPAVVMTSRGVGAISIVDPIAIGIVIRTTCTSASSCVMTVVLVSDKPTSCSSSASPWTSTTVVLLPLVTSDATVSKDEVSP